MKRSVQELEKRRIAAREYRARGGVPLKREQDAFRLALCRAAADEMAEFDRKLFGDGGMTEDEEKKKRVLLVEVGKVADALRVTHTREGVRCCVERLRVLSSETKQVP